MDLNLFTEGNKAPLTENISVENKNIFLAYDINID